MSRSCRSSTTSGASTASYRSHLMSHQSRGVASGCWRPWSWLWCLASCPRVADRATQGRAPVRLRAAACRATTDDLERTVRLFGLSDRFAGVAVDVVAGLGLIVDQQGTDHRVARGPPSSGGMPSESRSTFSGSSSPLAIRLVIPASRLPWEAALADSNTADTGAGSGRPFAPDQPAGGLNRDG